MSSAARIVAGLGAAAGGFGLALQYVILHSAMTGDGASAGEAAWRYFAYFTILTNLFVTVVLARGALGGEGGINTPRVELMATTSILFVCVVYNLLLASRWDPQGWQKLADVLLHNVTPVMVALYWRLRPHGALRARDAVLAASWPLAYVVYGLTRGAFDGFYPYFFIDPTTQTWGQIALTLAVLVMAFVAGAIVLVWISGLLTRRPRASAARG